VAGLVSVTTSIVVEVEVVVVVDAVDVVLDVVVVDVVVVDLVAFMVLVAVSGNGSITGLLCSCYSSEEINTATIALPRDV